MFGQVVKKSIRKLSFKSTVIRPISKTTAHNNANSAPAKESENDYDLWINGWVIQNIGVFRTSPPF